VVDYLREIKLDWIEERFGGDRAETKETETESDNEQESPHE